MRKQETQVDHGNGSELSATIFDDWILYFSTYSHSMHAINKMPTRRDTLLVVLGMHRSGTSVTTRALEAMGAEFGDKLLPPLEGINDKGFFEDIDVNRINIDVMAAAGAAWHTAGPIDLDAIDEGTIAHQRETAIELLRDKTKGKIFAVKDPRMARLLPFWETVFDRLDLDVAYIIAIRNPISVCRSLQIWNKFSEEKCYLLWLAHVVPALRATEHKRRTLVDYDQLLDEPVAQLSRMANDLSLSLDANRASNFESDFLDGPLRHTRYSTRDVEMLNTASRQLKALYAALQIYFAQTNDESSSAFSSALTDAEQYLDDIAPILRYQWLLEKEAQQVEAKLQADSAEIKKLQDLAGEHEQLVRSMTASTTEARAASERAGLTLSAMEQSNSWRITAPLRFIRQQIDRRRPR
jgi:hypothetical protein